LLSRAALDSIAAAAHHHDRNDFTIDPKHEFAKFVHDSVGIEMIDNSRFCTLSTEVNCITRYIQPAYQTTEIGCGSGITNEDVFYAVKTFSGNHKSRVVVVKRTWAKQTRFIKFFSDANDTDIPAIDLGVLNTEQGHCQKTLAIISYFLKQDDLKHIPWLVVADDDTLLNVQQLHRVINCLPSPAKLILGERYGFGFESDGIGGYDYPTGGSGLVISREAAHFLSYSCECPEPDAMDDMIIGICASRLNIPILHSAAFHQAQRRDYAASFIERIRPISFHKFNDLDPYKEYMDHLHEAEPDPEIPHIEL